MTEVQRRRAVLSEVGGLPVRRALPQRELRTVGAWCFVDHFGPVGPAQAGAMQVGPHPHIGLQTVTWLLAGEVLHTDSLGSEQLIRPGQLNLMTAGHGIAHAESARPGPAMHGVQFWVALPEGPHAGPPAFAHLVDLPQADVGGATATVLLGPFAGERSPAEVHTPIVGVDLDLRGGRVVLPLEPGWEHAVLVLEGAVALDGASPLAVGELGHLAPGAEELVVSTQGPARALLLGGAPFGPAPVMWWNFVAPSRAEVVAAQRAWNAGDLERFGAVATDLERIPAPALLPGWG